MTETNLSSAINLCNHIQEEKFTSALIDAYLGDEGCNGTIRNSPYDANDGARDFCRIIMDTMRAWIQLIHLISLRIK
jgi:hypothetical protein